MSYEPFKGSVLVPERDGIMKNTVLDDCNPTVVTRCPFVLAVIQHIGSHIFPLNIEWYP
jgi:hypothetical protein